MNLDPHLAKIADFPKPGITFYDISPVLENPDTLKRCVHSLSEQAASYRPDVIVGLDARGFLFCVPVALELGIGSVMIRKAGKLPGEVKEESYALEYGEATLAVQTARNLAGKRIVIVDDLLATGGTVAAAQSLLAQVGAEVVASLFLIELSGLKGRDKLSGEVRALQTYEF